MRTIKAGQDTCILSYGPTVKMAFDVAMVLEEKGGSVSVISCHTIKPLDAAGVANACKTHARVIVIEEMVPHGSLGSRVKEIAWDTGAGCELKCFSLRDDFIHHYGDHGELLGAHGLTVADIVDGL